MKTALVTGSTSKIGKSIVIALANNGYNIIAHGYSSKNSIYKIQTQVKNIGKSCEIFLVDLCSLKQIREFTQILAIHYKSIDIIINNAASFKKKLFSNISYYEYNKISALNIRAPFFLIQGLLPLLKNGTNPCIINITDMMISKPYKGYSHYFLTKGALITLTKALANELHPYIRVNAIAPGFIKSNNTHKYNKKNIINTIFKQVTSTPKDIVQAILLLSSNTKKTNQTLYVDSY